MGHIIFLNGMGDVEVSWDKDVDHKMKLVIEEKMKEGVRFFSVGEYFGIIGSKQISNVSTIKNRKIKFDDEHLEEMYASGLISTVKSNAPKELTLHSRLSTADQVLASPHTIAAVRPLQGG